MTFWRSKIGKLFIGGCGAQVGMLLSFGGVVVGLLFFAICVLSSVLSISLTQEMTQLPTAAPT